MHKGRRYNKTGRSEGMPPFVAVTWEVLDSPGFRALTGTEAKVLLAVARRYNGSNQR